MWVYTHLGEKKKQNKNFEFFVNLTENINKNTNEGVKLSLQKVKNRYCNCPILKERKRNYPIKDQME